MATVVGFMVFILVGTSRASASKPDCGVRGSDSGGPSSQIVGGEETQPLEFPWQISLQQILTPGGDWEHVCGGALINDQYIATAAHCVEDDPTPSEYRVKVGEHRLYQDDPHERLVEISEVTIHPKRNADTENYDYAILKLETPLDFGGADSALMPVCLPDENQSFQGQTCTATGWGFTKDKGEISPVLRKVDLPILPFEQCKKDYKGDATIVKKTMICAGYEEGGKATCEGDSGGPLQCAREDGRYVLVGSTSFGEACAEPHKPPVFSRVSTQVEWYRSVAGETP